MTAGELIELLKQFPEHTLVTFNDGENGRTDVNSVKLEDDYHHSELKVLVIGREYRK